MSAEREGLAVHVHHNILVEYCYNLDERLAVIDSDKPPNEREVRKRLLALLSPEAIAALPDALVRAWAKYDRARAKYDRARAKYDRARAERDRAYAEYDRAWAERERARAEYYRAYAEYDRAWAERERARAEYYRVLRAWALDEKMAWHAKWCGCAEWNGKEIVFPKEGDR
jgi:hypothetical protein